MKILHFSDTHLGFSDLDLLNEHNINQREADFYRAFSQVIDDILDIRPDFVIHTGDLFHRTSPSNRAISFALSEFKRLENANIPVIIIAGNHSTPRSNQTAPILKIFENFKNFYVNYSSEYIKYEFDNIIFHTISHINDSSKTEMYIKECEANIDKNKKNILMLHASVGASYLMSEFGEWVYPSDLEYIFDDLDYVALGHWHKFGSVGKHNNVYYSGSTERTSLNDKSNTKGYVIATISDKLSVEYKHIDIREIISIEIDCRDFFANTLALEEYKDAIVDVTLLNLTPTQSLDIKNSDIKDIFATSFYVNIKREILSSGAKEYTDVTSMSLEEFFLAHIKEGSSDSEYERIKGKILELFSECEDDIN